MTAAAPRGDWLGDEDGRAGPALRWGAGFAVVAGLHIGLAWLVLTWVRDAMPALAPPPAAVMLELAPLPVAPAAPQAETPPPEPSPPPEPPPPEPLPPEPPPPEPPPPEPVVTQPLAPSLPTPAPEVAVPLPPKPPPKPRPRPVERRVVPPRAAEPPAAIAPSPPAPVAAAPAPGLAPPAPSNAVPNWQGRVLARLTQFKRYPAVAQEQREQGVTQLRFSMDREGNVLAARIERGSGHGLLDDEALALVRRAEPLPKPPPEVLGQRLELVVPIQFFLRERR